MKNEKKDAKRLAINARKRSSKRLVKQVIDLRRRIESLMKRGKTPELKLLIESEPGAKRLYASIQEMRRLAAGGRGGTVTGLLGKTKSPKTWATKVSGGKCSGK